MARKIEKDAQSCLIIKLKVQYYMKVYTPVNAFMKGVCHHKKNITTDYHWQQGHHSTVIT